MSVLIDFYIVQQLLEQEMHKKIVPYFKQMGTNVKLTSCVVKELKRKHKWSIN